MNKEHTKISDLKEGQTVRTACLFNNIRPSVTKLGSPFFFAELKDASGTIPAVCWKPDGSITPEHNGSIVVVAGTVASYNDQLQFSIETAEPIDPAEIDDILLSKLVPSAPIDLEEYIHTLTDLIYSIQDQDIREICNFELLYHVYDDFIRYPAAKSVHHAFLHGLLMHSVDMARMADAISALKPNAFNRDLLIAGALLHDVGKVYEFEVSPVTGLVIGYTAVGNLLGHSVIGAKEIEEAALTVEARDEVTLLLQHMVLAHHGDPNRGAAKEPMTIETELLHDLDLLDSRRQIYEEKLSDTPSGEFSAKVFALGHPVYHHELESCNDTLKED